MNLFSKKQKSAAESVQEYITLADVRGNILYSKSGGVTQFIKISPISTALMTETEKEQLTLRMTRGLSPIKFPFKILFLTRPTDVRQIIEFYEGIKSTTQDSIKREALTKTVRHLSQLANGGGILERQTFLSVQVLPSARAVEELTARGFEMQSALAASGVTCHICDETEIINMLGLFFSPAFSFSREISKTPLLPSFEKKEMS